MPPDCQFPNIKYSYLPCALPPPLRTQKIYKVMRNLSSRTSAYGSMRSAVHGMITEGSTEAMLNSTTTMAMEVDDDDATAQKKKKTRFQRHAEMESKVRFVEDNLQIAVTVIGNLRSFLTDTEFGAYGDLKNRWTNARVNQIKILLGPLMELAAGDTGCQRAAEEAITLIQDTLMKSGITYLRDRDVLNQVEESWLHLAPPRDLNQQDKGRQVIDIFRALLCKPGEKDDKGDASRLRTLIEAVMMSSNQRFDFGAQNALRLKMKMAGCPPHACNTLRGRTFALSTNKMFNAHEERETQLRKLLAVPELLRRAPKWTIDEGQLRQVANPSRKKSS